MPIRLPQIFHMLLLAVVATACAFLGARPTPTPTPSAASTPQPTAGAISHSIDPRAVILRMEQGGGLVPPGFLVTEAPQFTLYGDGAVIFKPVDTREGLPIGGLADLPFVMGHLEEAHAQQLLRYALETGHLATAHDQYDNPLIADASTTVFTVDAGGVQKQVNVYALQETTESGADADDRAAFALLAGRLNTFEREPNLGLTAPYDPAFYRLTLLEPFGDPIPQPLAWPWTDVSPDDFQAITDNGRRENVLDRDHVAKLLEVPNGGHVGVWVKTPDAGIAQIGVRPLLPEELPAP